MSCIKHSILLALLLVMNASAGHAGTLVGTGGDPVIFLQLELQRKIIVNTLERIQSDYASDPAGTEALVMTYCKNEGVLLTDEEVKTCARFILETAYDIIACNYGEHKLDFIVSEPNTPELVELFRPKYPGNPAQPVSAATYLSSCKENHWIYFNYSTFVRDMRGMDVFLTIAHEMGHKVLFRGQPIDDIHPVGGFDAGHKLLDAAAKVLFDYADFYGFGKKIVTPEQKVETFKLEDLKHFFACTVKHGTQTSDSFMFYNEIVEDHGKQLSRNYFKDARGFEVTPWTKAFVPGDPYFVRLEFKGNFDCRDSRDEGEFYLSMLLLVPNGSTNPKVLDQKFELENIICSDNPPPIVLRDSPNDLTVDCQFAGKHRL